MYVQAFIGAGKKCSGWRTYIDVCLNTVMSTGRSVRLCLVRKVLSGCCMFVFVFSILVSVISLRSPLTPRPHPSPMPPNTHHYKIVSFSELGRQEVCAHLCCVLCVQKSKQKKRGQNNKMVMVIIMTMMQTTSIIPPP